MPGQNLIRRVAIEGLTPNNTVACVPVSESGAIGVSLEGHDGQTGLFNQLIVSQKVPAFDLKSIYGVTELRDNTTVTGSATVTQTGGEYVLTTTASGTDSAVLRSKERGRYVAGQESECGIGVRVNNTAMFTGNVVARWGAFTSADGFGFGRDATGLFIFRRKGSSDTLVRQSAWNEDKLDGTGATGVTLDETAGNIFQIVFSWYGYGVIEYRVITQGSNGIQKAFVVHRTKVNSETSIADPNLPIQAKLDNAGTATAAKMFVAGRQYSVLGVSAPTKRSSGDYATAFAANTTLKPVISIQKKGGSFASVHALLSGFQILTDASVIMQLYLDADLTGASFGTPTDATAAETGIQSDTTATAIANGVLLYTAIAGSSGLNKARDESGADFPHLDVNEGSTITMAVKTVTATATVDAVLRVEEDW